MNIKANTKWGAKPYRLQVYLPADVQQALDKYAADQFSSDSRVTSAIVRKAITKFLEEAGYLDRQGGKQ